MTTRKQPRGKTTLAGVGHRHRMRREYLLKHHIDGSGCPECGRPIFRDPALNHDRRPLHADHWPIPRAVAGPHALASRLICASCNLAAGGRLRAALAGERLSDDSDRALDHERDRLAMDWPP